MRLARHPEMEGSLQPCHDGKPAIEHHRQAFTIPNWSVNTIYTAMVCDLRHLGQHCGSVVPYVLRDADSAGKSGELRRTWKNAVHPDSVLEVDTVVPLAMGNDMHVMTKVSHTSGELVNVAADTSAPSRRIFLADEAKCTTRLRRQRTRELEEWTGKVRQKIRLQQPARPI